MRDPPFTRLDILACRNLLIYLEPETQARVLAMFHGAVRPRGLLFLGASETIGDYERFRALDKKWRLYSRDDGALADRAITSRGGVSGVSRTGPGDVTQPALAIGPVVERIALPLSGVGNRTYENTVKERVSSGPVTAGHAGFPQARCAVLIECATHAILGANDSRPSTASTTVQLSTLQIGNGGTTGTLATNVLVDGTLSFNRSDAYTYDKNTSGSNGAVSILGGTISLTMPRR